MSDKSCDVRTREVALTCSGYPSPNIPGLTFLYGGGTVKLTLEDHSFGLVTSSTLTQKGKARQKKVG